MTPEQHAYQDEYREKRDVAARVWENTREQLTPDGERVAFLSGWESGYATGHQLNDAELKDLRAALAASQTREAALREAVQLARQTTDDATWGELCLAIERAINGVSPVADALGRVVRASVAERQQAKRWQDWGDSRSLPITADQEEKWYAFLLESGELGTKRRDAVDNLLAVAPHWGEPQGAGG